MSFVISFFRSISANSPGSFAHRAASLSFRDSGRRDLLLLNLHRAARSESSDGVAGALPAAVAAPGGLVVERAATVLGTLPASMPVPAESANCHLCFDAGFRRGPRRRCWDASDLVSSLDLDGPADAYLCLADLRQVVQRVFQHQDGLAGFLAAPDGFPFQVSQNAPAGGEFPRFPAYCICCYRDARQVLMDGLPAGLVRVAPVWVGRVRVVRVDANKAALAADIHRGQTIHPNENPTKIPDDSGIQTPASSQPKRIPN
jgi:hypothetical protein